MVYLFILILAAAQVITCITLKNLMHEKVELEKEVSNQKRILATNVAESEDFKVQTMATLGQIVNRLDEFCTLHEKQMTENEINRRMIRTASGEL